MPSAKVIVMLLFEEAEVSVEAFELLCFQVPVKLPNNVAFFSAKSSVGVKLNTTLGPYAYPTSEGVTSDTVGAKSGTAIETLLKNAE